MLIDYYQNHQELTIMHSPPPPSRKGGNGSKDFSRFLKLLMLQLHTLYRVHYLKLLMPHLHTLNIYVVFLLDLRMEGNGQSRSWISVLDFVF